jgi:hypothetical protein
MSHDLDTSADAADLPVPRDYPEGSEEWVDIGRVAPIIDLPADFLHAVRGHLREAISWLDDPKISSDLRSYAHDSLRTALACLPDERAVTDVLSMLHRSIDRGDLHTLTLIGVLPANLFDGREAHESALVPLGEHALRIGAVDALTPITMAAVRAASMTPPVRWLRAILEAESSSEPRECVVDLLDAWLRRKDSDPVDVAEIMRGRPALHARLWEPPEVFAPASAEGAPAPTARHPLDRW